MSDPISFCGPPLEVPGDRNVRRDAHDFLSLHAAQVRAACREHPGTFEKIVGLSGLSSEQVVAVLMRPEDVSAHHFSLVVAAYVHARQ